MKETNRERFIKLADIRVNNALNDIRLIGNLSNKASYEFSLEEVEMIFTAIRKELDESEGRFHGKQPKGRFSLGVSS